MVRRLLRGFAAMALVAQATPISGKHAAWQWQRRIVPNAVQPAAEQCAVLDADVFARAAPGLRDMRLVQDGREIAYATDISQDDPAHPPVRNEADRALYEVALVVPAHPSDRAGVEGGSAALVRPVHPQGWFTGEARLPAHVPVERVRLEPAPDSAESVRLRAAEAGRLREAETLDTTLTPAYPAAAFTIGANLQRDADVRLNASGDAAGISSFVLEMRRREICYQPLSASPLMLFFGNPGAPPVHYDYGRHYQPKAAPVLALLGPVEGNPAFHAALKPPRRFSTRTRLVMGMIACFAALLLTLRPLLRSRQ